MVTKRKKWLIAGIVLLLLVLANVWLVIRPSYKRAVEDAETYGDEPFRYEMNPRPAQTSGDHTVDQ
jgi:uncharacterized membrane protein